VPAIAATPAAYSGVFRWGPVLTRILLGSEADLVSRFGPPTNFNGESWFTVSSFLAYGGFVYVVRAGASNGDTVETWGNGTVGNVAFQTGNNKVQLDNTNNITVGMKVFYSNNLSLNPDQ